MLILVSVEIVYLVSFQIVHLVGVRIVHLVMSPFRPDRLRATNPSGI